MGHLIYKRNTKKSKKNTVITAKAIITLPGALITISLFNTLKNVQSESLLAAALSKCYAGQQLSLLGNRYEGLFPRGRMAGV
jgi:hypothetical protein